MEGICVCPCLRNRLLVVAATVVELDPRACRPQTKVHSLTLPSATMATRAMSTRTTSLCGPGPFANKVCKQGNKQHRGMDMGDSDDGQIANAEKRRTVQRHSQQGPPFPCIFLRRSSFWLHFWSLSVSAGAVCVLPLCLPTTNQARRRASKPRQAPPLGPLEQSLLRRSPGSRSGVKILAADVVERAVVGLAVGK